MKNVFVPTDILIPRNADMHKWSVIACDQYTSQPEYWEKIENLVGNAPSTLRLMLPEAYLGEKNVEERTAVINKTMSEYLSSDVFREFPQSLVLVRRTLANGKIRTGLVGALDLDEYDFSAESHSLIRATEGTVPSRLPPRVKVREGACLEMPHIMVFINDAENNILSSLSSQLESSKDALYDFELNGGGGSIKGYTIDGQQAFSVCTALNGLYTGDKNPVLFAIGDGNHSLATAKVCWEKIKLTLTDEEKVNHPARFSLVEIVNIHDEAIEFEPIHRVLFHTDTSKFSQYMKESLLPTGEKVFSVRLSCNNAIETLTVADQSIGTLIDRCEKACNKYCSIYGGTIDYVHNDDTAIQMSHEENCCGLLLPPMEKRELFTSVQQTGPFPKKSFSIGLSQDKRYYLECRKITK